MNGEPSDGEEGVRELLQGLTHGLPDMHAEIARLRHMDDALFGEGLFFFTATLIAIRAVEEPHLRRRFGSDYDEYRRHVPRTALV